MKLINIILAEPNEEYIQYFTKYVRNTEFSKQFIIQSFSNVDLLQSNLQQFDATTLLLLHSEWINKLQPSLIPKRIIILNESNVTTSEHSYPSIYKYQPLKKILSNLDSFHKEMYNRPSENELNTKLISIYSSTGGIGKTTVAVNLVKQLSTENKKVFYLNLESISSQEIFMPASKTDEFAQIIYYLKKKPSEINAKLLQLVKHDSATLCDYLNTGIYMNDVEEMSSQDVETLIKAIIDMKQYDVIVIDLDSSLHQRNWTSFAKSDYIIWLLLDDIQCKCKLKRVWQELIRQYEMIPEQFTEKIIFTINKYTGNLTNDYDQEGFQIHSFLPYIPQWKAVNHSDQLISSEIFNGSIMRLNQAIMGGDKEEEHRYE